MAWNGSEDKRVAAVPKKAVQASPSKWRGLVALVVVVAGGLAAWLVMRSSGRDAIVASDTAKPSRITEVMPQIPTNVAEQVVENAEEQERKEKLLKRREMLKKMTPDERLDFLFEEAKKRPIPELKGTNRIFRTGLEQTMGWVFTCELGDPPPLLPKMSMFDEAHLAEILIMDNPIKDTDSDRAKDNKEAVQLAKKEFIDFIKQGGAPEDFLPYYHGQLVQAHEESKAARKAMLDVIKNDPDIAPEYIKKVNDGLAAKGIKAVRLPPKLLEKYGVQLED